MFPGMPDAQVVAGIREKYTAISADLDERARRRRWGRRSSSLQKLLGEVFAALWRPLRLELPPRRLERWLFAIGARDVGVRVGLVEASG